ncbi:hypothetical protein AB0K60_14410 [Thermopolyspora sp. NPDC052614]|uniref:hypothetical protein n=1 Tax=Thermopolyspora sp. NPDC052614 TaxID=3155682 RepID=UPI00342B1E99
MTPPDDVPMNVPLNAPINVPINVPLNVPINMAADSAQVAVQAAVVHGDVNYVVPADPSPRERFEAGARHLDGGMPQTAWRLIHDAVVRGHRTDEVLFHWLLALLSGRTRRELSAEEATQLRDVDRLFPAVGEGPWADGVRTIRRLLDAAARPDADIRLPMKEFDELPETQRAMILRHLELFLEGPLNDQMWRLRLERAAAEQMSGNRAKRVWTFFQPSPGETRVRPPQSVAISAGTWAGAVGGTIVLAAATAHIGALLVQGGRTAALVAYALSVVSGWLAFRDGAEWRFRTARRRAKDAEHGEWHGNGFGFSGRRRPAPPADGFARQVDRRFEYYFAKYVPEGVERKDWLEWTAGIRASLRDEVADAYRDTGVAVNRINWLIRYRTGRVVARWTDGTLWDYRRALAVPATMRATAVLGTVTCVISTILAARGAIQVSSFEAVRSLVLIVAAGWVAGRSGMRVVIERRRYAADVHESNRLLDDSRAALHRWRQRLADRPDDREMAAWLDHDRKVLLAETLEHYRLSMSDVVAHAFIEAPHQGSADRARVRGGPWRYRKYRLLIFLLTSRGVRQLTATLDFETGEFHDHDELNYRFETISSVRVRQADTGERTFELSLLDGQKISLLIEPGVEELQQGEDPGTVSEATLDAAGIRHTLHVLAGIAAEGKKWIDQERNRAETSSALRRPPQSGDTGREHLAGT